MLGSSSITTFKKTVTQNLVSLLTYALFNITTVYNICSYREILWKAKKYLYVFIVELHRLHIIQYNISMTLIKTNALVRFKHTCSIIMSVNFYDLLKMSSIKIFISMRPMCLTAVLLIETIAKCFYYVKTVTGYPNYPCVIFYKHFY